MFKKITLSLLVLFSSVNVRSENIVVQIEHSKDYFTVLERQHIDAQNATFAWVDYQGQMTTKTKVGARELPPTTKTGHQAALESLQQQRTRSVVTLQNMGNKIVKISNHVTNNVGLDYVIESEGRFDKGSWDALLVGSNSSIELNSSVGVYTRDINSFIFEAVNAMFTHASQNTTLVSVDFIPHNSFFGKMKISGMKMYQMDMAGAVSKVTAVTK